MASISSKMELTIQGGTMKFIYDENWIFLLKKLFFINNTNSNHMKVANNTSNDTSQRPILIRIKWVNFSSGNFLAI